MIVSTVRVFDEIDCDEIISASAAPGSTTDIWQWENWKEEQNSKREKNHHTKHITNIKKNLDI